MTEFDEDGFWTWLMAKRYGRNTALNYVSGARRCFQDRATTVEAIDEVYAHRSNGYRSDRRGTMRRYREFEADARSAGGAT